MKTFWTLLAMSGLSVMLIAQTNAPATAGAARPQTKITAVSVDMSVKERLAVYTGNVRVEDPLMTLTCELLTARMFTNSMKPESIVAEKNVVVDCTDNKGQTGRATADKLVYSYKVADGVTNEGIVLTGNPQLTTSQLGSFIGDPIVWDITSGRIVAQAPVTRINLPTNTIAPVLEKFSPEKNK
ncbi:MAG: hypothetical protein EXS35_00290 [Pedosphaera sp.]|nr:hypothetical protein [Pedosphaera sp.]